MHSRAVGRRLAAAWLPLCIAASACQGGSGSSGKHDPAPTDIDGTPWGSSVVVPAYGGVVLFPAEWMTDPQPG